MKVTSASMKCRARMYTSSRSAPSPLYVCSDEPCRDADRYTHAWRAGHAIVIKHTGKGRGHRHMERKETWEGMKEQA